MYQQYETLAPRYLPSASPRAAISGLGSHIADTHLEAMVYVIYISWLRGVYQQYETRAPRYLPEAKPRADIEGRGSHIADTLREDMVHIICSIAYCNIKLHNCPPLLLGPFRLPPGSVLAPKKTNLSNRPFPPLF